jgi:glycosyltransferase involved in cell wall biosynthesis
MAILKKKICWLTPDYFLNVDAHIVPHLSRYYDLEWILINTYNTTRHSDGLLTDAFTARKYTLSHRQRDPRILLDYCKLLFAIRNSGADLVYVSFHGLPYFFPIVFLLLDRHKIIYGVHNVTTPTGAGGAINERAMRLYHRYVFKNIEQFHVFSTSQLKTISQLLPSKRHYYAPLALEDYGPSDITPPTDKIRFLFLGYIRQYKGVDLLIESFQRLHNIGARRVELLIAGSCDNWEYYRPLITSSERIKTRIELIPNKDIPDLVSSCHYVILPYTDGTQSGILNLAYRYNKPVIVSDIDAFKQFVVEGSTGFMFHSKSSDSLTAVIRDTILQHDKRYRILQNNIEQYVKKELSLDRLITKYRVLLDECMNREPSTQG